MINSEEDAKSYVRDFADSLAIERLERFISLLIDENSMQNLISRSSVPEIWLRHIADSAQLLAHVPRETSGNLTGGAIWLDLGTGAGFPGLAIAVMRPHWDVRLVESRRRRCEFLDRVRNQLGLHRCSIYDSRLEMIPDLTASVISARAFAPMPRLLELSARFSTERTLWLLPKGRSAAQDLATLPESARAMFHVEQSATDPEAGIVVGHIGTGRKQQVRPKA